jgi:hypothetical protein
MRLLDLQIRTGRFGDRYGENPGGLTLQSFEDAPHGIDMGPLVPRLHELLNTPSGKVELAPEQITADVPRLRARVARETTGLLLVSRRHLRSNNSWMHNVKVLVRAKTAAPCSSIPTTPAKRASPTEDWPGSPPRPTASKCRSRSATR